jgi:hypothetical protein
MPDRDPVRRSTNTSGLAIPFSRGEPSLREDGRQRRQAPREYVAISSFLWEIKISGIFDQFALLREGRR